MRIRLYSEDSCHFAYEVFYEVNAGVVDDLKRFVLRMSATDRCWARNFGLNSKVADDMLSDSFYDNEKVLEGCMRTFVRTYPIYRNFIAKSEPSNDVVISIYTDLLERL